MIQSSTTSPKESTTCLPWLSQIIPWRSGNLTPLLEVNQPCIAASYHDLKHPSGLPALKSINDSDRSLSDILDLPTQDAPLLEISEALRASNQIGHLENGLIKIDDQTFKLNQLSEDQRLKIGKGLRGVAEMNFTMSTKETLQLLNALANVDALDSSLLKSVLDTSLRREAPIDTVHTLTIELLNHPNIAKKSDLRETVIGFGVKQSSRTTSRYGISSLAKKLLTLQKNQPHIHLQLESLRVKISRSAPSGMVLLPTAAAQNQKQQTASKALLKFA